MDKAEAERNSAACAASGFAKRKNVVALLRETIFQQESPLVDTDASNKAADADAALQELGSDQSRVRLPHRHGDSARRRPGSGRRSCAWWSASSRVGAS